MRILHIIQPLPESPRPWHRPARASSPDAALTLVRDARQALARHEHDVLILGSARGEACARLAGLRTHDRASPPNGSPRLAAPGLRAYAHARGEYDVIQPVGPRDWAQRLALPASLGDAWVALWNTDSGLVEPLVGPGVWPRPGEGPGPWASRPTLSRERARELVGFECDDLLVGVVADPGANADAAHVAFLLHLLHASGLRVRAAVPRGTTSLARAWRAARSDPRGAPPLIPLAWPLHPLLRAFDLLFFGVGSRFVDAPRPATFAETCLVHSALELGIPVVSSDASVIPEPLRREMLAESAHPSAFARLAVRWLDSAARDDRGERGFGAFLASPAASLARVEEAWLGRPFAGVSSAGAHE